MFFNSAGLFQAALISRLIFGAGFLFAAVYNQQFTAAVLQLLLSVLLLRMTDGNFQRLLRAIRLLLWIVLPMVVVHMLFSPGRLVEFFWVQISIDGALFGGWLAFHFITIFMAALLFFRMLTTGEWLHLLVKSSLLRSRLLPYVVLVQPLRSKAGAIIGRCRRYWQQGDKGIRHLSLILLLLVRKVLAAGPAQAKRLWSNWESEMENILAAPEERHAVSVPGTVFWLLLTAGWLWLAIGEPL